MKKIFCIFAVVLILIMATVPCFAAQPYPSGITIYNVLPYRDTVLTFSGVTFTCTGGNFITTTGTATDRFWLSDFRPMFTTNRLYSSHVYYLYISEPGNYFGCSTYSGDYWSFVVNTSTSFSPPRDLSVTFGFSGYFQPSSSLYVSIFDLTSIYGSGNESVANFSSLLENYGYDLTIEVLGSRYISNNQSFFGNISSFYQNLFHLTDYASNWNNISTFFVFFAICLGMLFVIFVIYLIIRRCRS